VETPKPEPVKEEPPKIELEPIVEEKEELPEPVIEEDVSTDSDIVLDEHVPDSIPVRQYAPVKEQLEKIMNYETVKL
jgi:hypothetical protein